MGYLAVLLGAVLIGLVSCKPYNQDSEDDLVWDTSKDDTVNPFASFVLDDYTEFRRRKREAGEVKYFIKRKN